MSILHTHIQYPFSNFYNDSSLISHLFRTHTYTHTHNSIRGLRVYSVKFSLRQCSLSNKKRTRTSHTLHTHKRCSVSSQSIEGWISLTLSNPWTRIPQSIFTPIKALLRNKQWTVVPWRRPSHWERGAEPHTTLHHLQPWTPPHTLEFTNRDAEGLIIL